MSVLRGLDVRIVDVRIVDVRMDGRVTRSLHSNLYIATRNSNECA